MKTDQENHTRKEFSLLTWVQENHTKSFGFWGWLQENQSHKPFSLLGWMHERLKAFGDLRDDLLVTATIIYIVGYMVWSFYAWRYHSGLLPALDPQYFVAGLAPVLIMFVAYLGGRYFKRFLVETWPAKVGKEATGLWLVIRKAVFFMFWVFFSLVVLGPILAVLLSPLIYIGYRFLKRSLLGSTPKNLLSLGTKDFVELLLDRIELVDKEVKGWRQTRRPAFMILALVAFLVLLHERTYLSRMILSEYPESPHITDFSVR